MGIGEPASISGTVVDTNGNPIPQAEVYIEQGITGAITRTKTGNLGEYTFSDVYPGFVGVFAYKPGFAFNGYSAHTSIAETKKSPSITLEAPSELNIKILDPKNDGIRGARVTRVSIDKTVSIPLGKLQSLGWNLPTSRSDGNWNSDLFSNEQTLELKIGHARFAQATLIDVSPGKTTHEATMTPGVLISGSVFMTNSSTSVSNAWIQIKNMFPPNETILTRTGGDGSFGLRLNPGQYIYEAIGSEYRSPSISELLVTGQSREQSIAVYVAEQSPVRGKVIHVISGLPIQGARMQISVLGRPRETRYTGPTGEFQFMAAAGENTVSILSAPGFLNPSTPNIEFTASPKKNLDLPTFWLAPVPEYSLLVLDLDGNPLPEASVMLLDPLQYGWHRSDDIGEIEFTIASLPKSRNVVGIAEHPTHASAALFSIPEKQSEKAGIHLVPAVTVSGAIVPRRAQPIMMGLYYGNDQLERPLLIKSTLTDTNGAFRFHGIPSGIPLFYGPLGSNPSQWQLFKAQEGNQNNIDEILISQEWEDPLPQWNVQQFIGANSFLKREKSHILMYAGSHPQPDVMIELLKTIQNQYVDDGLRVVWVTSDSIETNPDVDIIREELPPGYSRYFFVDKSKKIRYESLHVPSSNSLARFSAP
jgi:hypothetical protein